MDGIEGQFSSTITSLEPSGVGKILWTGITNILLIVGLNSSDVTHLLQFTLHVETLLK